MSLDHGESLAFYLHIVPHDNETMPDDGAALEVTVSVQAQTGDASDSQEISASCHHEVKRGVQLLETSENNRWLQVANPVDIPQEGLLYRFLVENTGEKEDSFHLMVETNTGSGIYQGWEIKFETDLGLDTSMEVPADLPTWTGGDFLQPGERVEVRIRLWPHENAEVSGMDLDRYGDMELSAQSLEDTQARDEIDFRLIVVKPDLRITDEDIHLDTSDRIEEGDSIELEITVHNDGGDRSGNFDLWVYRQKEDSFLGIGGTVGSIGLLAHLSNRDSIGPQSGETFLLDWELQWGEHDIYVYVDKPITAGSDKTSDPERGNVIEESEQNNDARMGIDPRSGRPYREFLDLRPWIEVLEIDFDDVVREDDTLTVTVTIYNNDSKTAISSYGTSADDVDMYIRCKAGESYLKPRKAGTTEQGYKVNEVLEPDDELAIEFSWTVKEEENDRVKIKVYIDYEENKNPKNSFTTTEIVQESSGTILPEGANMFIIAVMGTLVLLVLILAIMLGRRKPGISPGPMKRPPGPRRPEARVVSRSKPGPEVTPKDTWPKWATQSKWARVEEEEARVNEPEATGKQHSPEPSYQPDIRGPKGPPRYSFLSQPEQPGEEATGMKTPTFSFLSLQQTGETEGKEGEEKEQQVERKD